MTENQNETDKTQYAKGIVPEDILIDVIAKAREIWPELSSPELNHALSNVIQGIATVSQEKGRQEATAALLFVFADAKRNLEKPLPQNLADELTATPVATFTEAIKAHADFVEETVFNIGPLLHFNAPKDWAPGDDVTPYLDQAKRDLQFARLAQMFGPDLARAMTQGVEAPADEAAEREAIEVEDRSNG